jgi:hypothetical protein
MRAVSRATGESLGTIRRLGFSVVPTQLVVVPPEPEPLSQSRRPQVIDWDELDQARVGLFPVRAQPLPAAA